MNNTVKKTTLRIAAFALAVPVAAFAMQNTGGSMHPNQTAQGASQMPRGMNLGQGDAMPAMKMQGDMGHMMTRMNQMMGQMDQMMRDCDGMMKNSMMDHNGKSAGGKS